MNFKERIFSIIIVILLLALFLGSNSTVKSQAQSLHNAFGFTDKINWWIIDVNDVPHLIAKIDWMTDEKRDEVASKKLVLDWED